MESDWSACANQQVRWDQTKPLCTLRVTDTGRSRLKSRTHMNQSTACLVQWSPKHAIYNMQGEWASRDPTLFSSIHSLTTQSGSREGIQAWYVQRKTHGKYLRSKTRVERARASLTRWFNKVQISSGSRWDHWRQVGWFPQACRGKGGNPERVPPRQHQEEKTWRRQPGRAEEPWHYMSSSKS